MNASKKRKNAASPANVLIAAGLAAIVGFGTVYWFFAPSDNGSGLAPPPQSPPATVESAGGTAGASALKGLNKGAMAAFVVRPKPLDVPAFAFEGPDGAKMTSADLMGKVVLLNIWATWCVPCREEMPQLNALQADFGGDDFEVAAINIDKGGADKARKFLDETGASDLPFYVDPTGKLFAALKAVGMPTTVLLNAQGKELGRLVGPADWASPEAKKLVQAAIADAAAQ